MKTCFLQLLILCFAVDTASAQDPMRIRGPGAVLTEAPASSAGRVRNRRPASEEALRREAENRALFARLKPGTVVIIQNSVHDWDDQVGTVLDTFEDGSVRIQLRNGRKAFVKAENLASSLSIEVACGDSHGERICKGDTVFYPVRASSLEIPEAPVSHVFENGTVVIRDGGEFVFDLKQVGKARPCSPQRESICTGDYVFAESFREDSRFTFEGPVEKTYSHGVVLVKVNGRWRYPIDVNAVKKRLASADPTELDPAVITNRNTRSAKDLPYRVTPELEPFSVDKADGADSAR